MLPMIKINAPSFRIPNQVPSGSIGLSLALQLSDKTLKSLYPEGLCAPGIMPPMQVVGV